MHDFVYDIRHEQHLPEKKIIGRYTGCYLRKHATNLPVAVDGGTTNFYVLQAIYQDLIDRRATVSQVLTNHLEGIYLARNLPDNIQVPWRCTGGILRRSTKTFVSGAEEAIRTYAFSTAVVGANGFDPPWLETTTATEQAVKQALIRGASKIIIFPIDSSKWGHPTGQYLYTLDEIVSWRKTVELITCFPIQDHDEENYQYEDRKRSFLHALRIAMSQGDYNKAFYLARVNEDDVDFLDFSITDVTDIQNAWTEFIERKAKPVRISDSGLIIRFDLWPDQPC